MTYIRIGIYALQGEAIVIAQQATEELLPILRQQPGFVDYELVAAGPKLISISAWEFEEQAAEGAALAATYISGHLDAQLTLDQHYIGDLVLSSRT
jgi:hypothetical protein